MARTRKAIQPLNLYKYDVLIDDQGPRSDYFKISQFDGYFYGGRNAFLIAGAGVLRPNSKILVEILNKDGETVYSAPVQNFVEGSSRLVQIEIYENTPIGPGKIVILGSTDKYINNQPIPKIWENKYNVRWTTDVIISPLIENKTPIRFTSEPTITVEEKFYQAPSSSFFSQSISVPVDIELAPKYFNVYPNGYSAKIVGPANTRYFNEYLNGKITGSIIFTGSSGIETANIDIPISKIYNLSTADSVGSLIYTNKNNLLLGGVISGSGQYTTKLNPFGQTSISSSLQILYNKLETSLTAEEISFAKIRLSNLSTKSGEIHKVRVSYKSSTEPGEFVSLGDIPTGVSELLSVDSGSKIVETGKFRDIVIGDYWYSATMSLSRNDVRPTLPNYYKSASLVTTSPFLNQCCANILDAVSGTPTIVSQSFINNVSYFIGTKPNNNVTLLPNSEYTLKFNAFAAKTSASITLNQPDYSLEVYLVQESGSVGTLLETSTKGQLIGTLTPTKTFQLQNFETVEFNFVPKINQTGDFGLRFIVYGGFWDIANVSLKVAQENFFSPDEVDILVPNVNFKDKLLTFKAEYVDINNNSTDVITTSLPTYFSGSESTTNGGGGGGTGAGFPFSGSAVITGSLLVSGSGITGSLFGTSSFSETSSYSLVAEAVRILPGDISSTETQYSGSISGSNAFFGRVSASLFSGSGENIFGVISSSYALSSSFATTSSFSISSSNALTSSFASFATTSSFAISSSQATTASFATTSSFVNPYNASFTGLTIVGTTTLEEILEKVTISATAATGTINFDTLTQAVLYYTTNASGNWTLNIRGNSTTTLDTVMTTGQSLTLAFLVTNGTTPYYQTGFQIDGSSVTPKWQGGSAPTAGNASSVDIYTLTVVKTGNAAFTVFEAQTQFK